MEPHSKLQNSTSSDKRLLPEHLLPEHKIGGWIYFTPENYDQKSKVVDADDEEAVYAKDNNPEQNYNRRKSKEDISLTPVERKHIMIRRITEFSGNYSFFCGKMFNEVIAHDGLRYWQLAELSEEGPHQIQLDGTQLEPPGYYKWRLGANGLPLPIFNGARIRCSRKSRRVKKALHSAPSDTNTSLTSHGHTTLGHTSHRPHKHKRRHQEVPFDFFFDANGEILKVNGDKLSYHWHLFDLGDIPIEFKDVHADPGKLIFRYDGKIFNLTGLEQDFKWMYIHQDGSLLDPAYEDKSSLTIFPADGSFGMKLLTNPDGSIFISKFGKPVLIVEEELDIYGPGGNKILIFNDEDEYLDPNRNELKVGQPVLDSEGNSILFVESLEENSKRLGVEIPEVHYSGFNVKLDKWGNIIAGNPITLDPNGPPVLLIKYTSTSHAHAKQDVASKIQKKIIPFIEKSNYMPFWIIDPDGKLIVLHDKDGLLWDRHYNPYQPTGVGEEPNGDTYEYYLFSGNDRPCDENSICFHPEILDSEDEDEEEGEGEIARHSLDVFQLKKIFNFHEELYGKTDTAMFQCFQFPKCLKDGSYQQYLRSICFDRKKSRH